MADKRPHNARSVDKCAANHQSGNTMNVRIFANTIGGPNPARRQVLRARKGPRHADNANAMCIIPASRSCAGLTQKYCGAEEKLVRSRRRQAIPIKRFRSAAQTSVRARPSGWQH
jgi:hypothetical protein